MAGSSLGERMTLAGSNTAFSHKIRDYSPPPWRRLLLPPGNLIFAGVPLVKVVVHAGSFSAVTGMKNLTRLRSLTRIMHGGIDRLQRLN
jgi:hypothetical protein